MSVDKLVNDACELKLYSSFNEEVAAMEPALYGVAASRFIKRICCHGNGIITKP